MKAILEPLEMYHWLEGADALFHRTRAQGGSHLLLVISMTECLIYHGLEYSHLILQ